MLKREFRGERKRNPHPDHTLSYSETSPKERGDVVTVKGSVVTEKVKVMWRECGGNVEEILTLLKF